MAGVLRQVMTRGQPGIGWFIAFGICAVLLPSADAQQDTYPADVTRFLQRFDEIARRGFVPTSRSGSTGVGHTLEELLGLTENNRPQGDFDGIEVKAWRQSPKLSHRRRPMNLFLKEPQWLDHRVAADRVRQCGYLDRRGRQAWYQSVIVRENSGGLQLLADDRVAAVLLLDEADAIGLWPYDVLERRLLEKHRQAIYVSAESRGQGAQEEFRYRSVVWCQQPSLDRFLRILREGDVIVELRMHITKEGRVRNHGTAFRIRRDRIVDLYQQQQILR